MGLVGDLSKAWTRENERERIEGMMKETKRKLKRREWAEKGGAMKRKDGGNTGRREGLEGRERKCIYSQESNSRLHEKALITQDLEFSHLFAKP